MRLDKIRDVLVAIESSLDVNGIQAEGVCLWPILRLCIWRQLAIDQNQEQPPAKISWWKSMQRLTMFLYKLLSKAKRLITYFFSISSQKKHVEIVFLTRPVYLQKLSSGQFFDRMIDPLVSLIKNKKNVSKLCIGEGKKPKNLYFDFSYLAPNELERPQVHPQFASSEIKKIAEIADLDESALLESFKRSCTHFFQWYNLGTKLFRKMPFLKHVYVTSWYFPDMMGLIAAAKDRNVNVTDLQHGQQGRYQIMYTWWAKIPSDGYKLLPDKFWCWGQTSVDHIIQVNNNVQAHQAFVGGYPWIDYYKLHINENSLDASHSKEQSKHRLKVVFTLQPPSGEHQEPIPDFIVDFLMAHESSQGISFTFRCHPNFKGCLQYIKDRLKSIGESQYVISRGDSLLYDDFLSATHHVTAFSSCCYEAEVFGIPTLLFGSDALENYEDEIKNNVFAWTPGEVSDFINWLNKRALTNPSNYVVSSLDLAKKQLFFSENLQNQ